MVLKKYLEEDARIGGSIKGSTKQRANNIHDYMYRKLLFFFLPFFPSLPGSLLLFFSVPSYHGHKTNCE